MPVTYTWATPGTYATAIVGTSSGLRNMANAALVLGSEIDNQAGPRLGALDLYVKLASAPSGTPYFAGWFIKAVDGSNYEDGSSSVTPARPADFIIEVALVNTQQRIGKGPFLLPNSKFKILLRNSTGQATTNANDTDNILSIRPWADLGT